MGNFFKATPRLEQNGDYWRVAFYDSASRERTHHYLGTTSEQVAHRRYWTLVEAYERGEFDPFVDDQFEFEALTVKDAQERFESYNDRRVQEGAISPRTAEDYTAFLKTLRGYLPAGLLLRQLTEARASAFLFQDQLSGHTSKGYYQRLNAFLNWCAEEDLVKRNPLAEINKPRPGTPVPDFLTRREFEALLRVIRRDYKKKLGKNQIGETHIIWLCDAIQLAVATGIRRSKLLSLRWIDVDRASGFVYVRSASARSRGAARGRTKNRDERSVPIFPLAREALERLAQKRGGNPSPTETVLLNQSRQPLRGNYVSQKFREYRRMTGLPETYKWHSLRDTFASWLRLRGVPLDRIKKWLGHQTIEQTMRYAHVVPEDIAREGDVAFPRMDPDELSGEDRLLQ